MGFSLVRRKRIESDLRDLRELEAKSGGMMKIVEHTQDRIKIRLEGIPGLVYNNGRVTRITRHEFVIRLPSRYPVERPQVHFLTDIFHPNIFSSKEVCLGDKWDPSRSLADLVLDIVDIIQWEPRMINLRSPANTEAKRWYERNRNNVRNLVRPVKFPPEGVSRGSAFDDFEIIG